MKLGEISLLKVFRGLFQKPVDDISFTEPFIEGTLNEPCIGTLDEPCAGALDEPCAGTLDEPESKFKYEPYWVDM